MCGIGGVISTTPVESHADVVRAILESQRRRGPDHEAIETVGTPGWSAMLSHNRLSIIDLSPAGHQPMWDAERRCCVVFNGEIYNYIELRAELATHGRRCVTQSDTEVILEAYKLWGPAAVERFNGMFAFALVDVAQKRFWLCRDRFGVKPLYFRLEGDRLWFASTGRALASRLSLRPNLDYVARGLKYWVYEDDGTTSPYEGLSALPAGHSLVASPSGTGGLAVDVRRYYDPFARVEALRAEIRDRSEEALLGSLAELLQSSIDFRLRSDVPLAISLSGGLDSSSVAALVAERRRNPTGFTFGDPEDGGSEGPLARALGEQAGIEVSYIAPTVERLAEAFWEVLEAQDAPFTSASVIAQYLVFEKARRSGFKVLLGGQGGDEALMGYRKFVLFHLRELARGGGWMEAARYAMSILPLLAAELPSAPLYWSIRRRYDRGMPHTLRLPSPEPLDLSGDRTKASWHRQLLDLTRLSLPTLLRYEDRNSMGHSVESRLPFLDYRLVELGVAMPAGLKLRHGYGKWALREIMRGKIPESIRAARYKKGFSVDQKSWFHRGLGDAMRRALHARASAIRPWMLPEASIEATFSNDALARRPTAFFEAVSLLWLAERS